MEPGIDDICSSLTTVVTLGENSTNATKSFLAACNVKMDKRSERRKQKKNKKKDRQRFSTLSLLKSLPKIEKEAVPEPLQKAFDNLQVKPVSSEEFYFNQKDSKKFYKKILTRERKRQRLSKRTLPDQDGIVTT